MAALAALPLLEPWPTTYVSRQPQLSTWTRLLTPKGHVVEAAAKVEEASAEVKEESVDDLE
jgi:hypothetical protein